MEQSLSLLEFFALLEDLLEVKLDYVETPVRQSDQKIFVADISKIREKIGWSPAVSARKGLEDMVQWVAKTM